MPRPLTADRPREEIRKERRERRRGNWWEARIEGDTEAPSRAAISAPSYLRHLTGAEAVAALRVAPCCCSIDEGNEAKCSPCVARRRG